MQSRINKISKQFDVQLIKCPHCGEIIEKKKNTMMFENNYPDEQIEEFVIAVLEHAIERAEREKDEKRLKKLNRIKNYK